MSEPASPPPTAATGTVRPPFTLRHEARDFLNVAVFVVIYSAVVFAVAMLGVINPLVVVLAMPLAPLAAGIPYMLFLSRVRHGGTITLFGIAFALTSMGWGHPWQSALVIVGCSLIGEVGMCVGRYRSKWAAIWTYTAFSAWMIGPWIPFFLDPAGYMSQQVSRSTGDEYAKQMEAFLTGPVVLGVWIGGIGFGFLGGLLGAAVLRKHFEKAGLA